MKRQFPCLIALFPGILVRVRDQEQWDRLKKREGRLLIMVAVVITIAAMFLIVIAGRLWIKFMVLPG